MDGHRMAHCVYYTRLHVWALYLTSKAFNRQPEFTCCWDGSADGGCWLSGWAGWMCCCCAGKSPSTGLRELAQTGDMLPLLASIGPQSIGEVTRLHPDAKLHPCPGILEKRRGYLLCPCSCEGCESFPGLLPF